MLMESLWSLSHPEPGQEKQSLLVWCLVLFTSPARERIALGARSLVPSFPAAPLCLLACLLSHFCPVQRGQNHSESRARFNPVRERKTEQQKGKLKRGGVGMGQLSSLLASHRAALSFQGSELLQGDTSSVVPEMCTKTFVQEFIIALFVIVNHLDWLCRVHYDKAIKMVFLHIFSV